MRLLWEPVRALDDLQNDLAKSGGTPVQILAINEAGYESGEAKMARLGDLPLGRRW